MIFLKKSQFIVISDEKRQFSKLHFSQKVCETEYSDTALKNFDSVHIYRRPWFREGGLEDVLQISQKGTTAALLWLLVSEQN